MGLVSWRPEEKLLKSPVIIVQLVTVASDIVSRWINGSKAHAAPASLPPKEINAVLGFKV